MIFYILEDINVAKEENRTGLNDEMIPSQTQSSLVDTNNIPKLRINWEYRKIVKLESGKGPIRVFRISMYVLLTILSTQDHLADAIRYFSSVVLAFWKYVASIRMVLVSGARNGGIGHQM